MDPNDANMELVLAKLRAFECFMFPKTKEGIRGYCRAVCLMLQDQPQRFDKKHENGWTWIESLECLIDEAMETFEKLPTPAELREIYKGEFHFSTIPVPKETVALERWLYDHPGKSIGLYDEALYHYTDAVKSGNKQEEERWGQELGFMQ